MTKSKRSKNEKFVSLSTLIPKDLDDRLHEFTDRKGLKIKAVVIQAIEGWLEREGANQHENHSGR